MLPDVIPVVAAVHEVRVVEDVMRVEPLDEPVYEFVDGLERAQTLPVKVVVVLYVGAVLLR